MKIFKLLHKTSRMVLPLVLIWSAGGAGAGQQKLDDTLLMFVGEELSVVTVASRKAESPAEAPAVIRVVDRTAIENRGLQTLGELLAFEPGFYVAERAQGSIPYLRGIPGGVLFLYDGVPLTTESTKNVHALDRELSLHAVKQVEILRGPGSVLWGPDAFAGIVNVVPMSGRDLCGVESGMTAGSDRLLGAYLNWGQANDQGDVFLSANATRDRYHNDAFGPHLSMVDPEQGVIGEGHIDDSDYLELIGNAHIGNWLSLSGRLSDFSREFTMQDTTSLSWEGERESPSSYLKATLSKAIGQSHFSLTGYYHHMRHDVTNVDLKSEQKNEQYHAELLWDRPVTESGRLTAGVSFRQNNIEAIVKEGFQPEFANPDNKFDFKLQPVVRQKEYDNTLKSVFAQYRFRLNSMECWLGGRLDDHSQYGSTFSYSMGANYPLHNNWRLKAAYGTAYRSPYPGQLYGSGLFDPASFNPGSFDPEGIQTLNLQLSWNPKPERNLALTLFHSRLSDHVQENPYSSSGLSAPFDYEVAGVELSGRVRLFHRLEAYANFTAFNAWGEDADYLEKFFFPRPDGTSVTIYRTWDGPFDSGPDVMASMGLSWQFHPKAILSLDGLVTSNVPFTFAKESVIGSFNNPPLVNLSLVIKDAFLKNSRLTLAGKNIFDQDYDVAGRYGPEEGKSQQVFVEWSVSF